VAVEEGDHAVVQKIGCRDRRLAIIELGASNLGVGVDERLLVDAPKLAGGIGSLFVERFLAN
jgi:hypothetical protein